MKTWEPNKEPKEKYFKNGSTKCQWKHETRPPSRHFLFPTPTERWHRREYDGHPSPYIVYPPFPRGHAIALLRGIHVPLVGNTFLTHNLHEFHVFQWPGIFFRKYVPAAWNMMARPIFTSSQPYNSWTPDSILVSDHFRDSREDGESLVVTNS